jgi:hypothetical protein
MSRILLAMPVAVVLGTLVAAPADAQEALRFASCAALRHHIDTRQPNAHVLLAPATYECRGRSTRRSTG